MKRKGLLIAAISAGLVLGAGSFSAWAATGWNQDNGAWVYYSSNGDLVTNDWKKGADDLWRYLDSSGSMAVNTWVDGEYYVDANGIMVADKWYQMANSFYGETDENLWYYFGSSGKVALDTWKKINDKWYHFGDDGAMETGWADDNMYFCGDDGAAKIGWQKLDPPEDESYDEDDSFDFDDDDGRKWYYFSSSGKKYVPDLKDGGDYGERRIDNSYYCFDANGAMMTGWTYLGSEDGDNADMAEYRFFGTDGKVKTGWYSAEPPENRSGYEDEVEWFYFSKSGVPRANKLANEGRLYSSDILTINKKRYLFNENGNPVYGLQKVYTNTSGDEYTAYYFGPDKSDCTAEVGRFKVEEEDGSTSEFYFAESGKGFTGIHNNSMYFKGKLQKADSSMKYQVISLPSGNSHTNYLVSTSGKVIKSTSGVKDSDGTKYATTSGGVLHKINDEVVGDEKFSEPMEPIWE